MFTRRVLTVTIGGSECARPFLPRRTKNALIFWNLWGFLLILPHHVSGFSGGVSFDTLRHPDDRERMNLMALPQRDDLIEELKRTDLLLEWATGYK